MVVIAALLFILDFAIVEVSSRVLSDESFGYVAIGWIVFHFIAGLVLYKKKGGQLSSGTWIVGFSEFGLLFNVIKIVLRFFTVFVFGFFAVPIKLAPILAALVMNKIGKSVPAPSRQEPVADTEMQI